MFDATLLDPSSISLTEQISELRREVRLREHRYPRWVEQGAISPAKAVTQLMSLKAALATLCALQAKGEA